MRSRFTEQETERYYDLEDATYRVFWDSEGSLHWGIFDESTGRDFPKASENLNRIMLGKAGIGTSSKVLDFGCGNGNTAIRLCRETGAQVVGIDLSGVRVNNARETARELPGEAQERLHFDKGSVTELPYEEETFTHVWSQATIYHVPDKDTALWEAYRVLRKGGLFVFDDLTKPRPDISEESRQYVYERLLFDTDFGFESYMDALTDRGFRVVEAHDLSRHLRTSYQCLSEMAGSVAGEGQEKFQALSYAYTKMVEAVEKGDLGWGLYVCEKR